MKIRQKPNIIKMLLCVNSWGKIWFVISLFHIFLIVAAFSLHPLLLLCLFLLSVLTGTIQKWFLRFRSLFITMNSNGNKLKQRNGNSFQEKEFLNSCTSVCWGRHERSTWIDVVLVSGMLLICPLIVVYFWTSCAHFQCEITGPILEYTNRSHLYQSFFQYLSIYSPAPSSRGFLLAGIWLLVQLCLYLFLPGPIGYGQLTPAGHILQYKVNGLNAWIVTHVCMAAAVIYELFPASIIADNWGSLLVVANLYGYTLSFFAYLKANLFPTHEDDCKFTGSFMYDFFMGVELNPRIYDFDFKLFHNGRPGIIGWSLINLSFMAKQYNDFGYVTNSMVLINILQLIYILDFFYHEDWYLRTIDIAHDHFGFYLSWGDSVWLPWMYTLQAFFLSVIPVELSNWASVGILLLGFGGYGIFRSVNSQKDAFRHAMTKNEKITIWGKSPSYIKAEFQTSDGQKRTSFLLTSGWWGISRHFNYVGDLMMSLAFCLTCGTNHILPYFYIFYMATLLVHRTHRDDARCSLKYGKSWSLYCEKVPWKIFPGVY
eukprot:Sdes_comp18949_c0_seq1m9457